MYGTARIASILAFLLALMGDRALGREIDIFGGTPVATDIDFFSRSSEDNTWQVRVLSFAYQAGSEMPPNVPGDAVPGPGETSFLYLVENIGTGPFPEDPAPTDTAITSFTVANPDEPGFGPAPILAIGRADLVVPLDWDDLLVSGDREDPRDYTVNPLNVDYNWRFQIFPPPPTDVLDINEFSIVYFRAEGTYTDRAGLVTGAAMTDSQMILGPIVPEPASMMLWLLASVAVLRRTTVRNRRV